MRSKATAGGTLQRTIGLWGATLVGIGAIVGGGILVLAGVAFSSTGPAAIVAFALNGLVAFVTAMSFAEISSSFPESGGAYLFAKKVLSVRAAFAVGWVVWFAYIVSGVLYALGFATFAGLSIHELVSLSGGTPPSWVTDRRFFLLLASGATILYSLSLVRKSTGGGQMATIGKVIVFVIVIIVGLVAVVLQPVTDTSASLSPFFAGGFTGLVSAMGFTFIALQGFDLIAAVAGEVKNPGRTIPRAMFLSLGAALIVYLPLLFVVTAGGVEPGHRIGELAALHGDAVIAVAVKRFMGPVGYWLIMVAAILSTLSALHANLLAASRVSLSMAQDRTLPDVLRDLHSKRATPVMAIYASALTLVAILFMIPNLAAAGAAASLIFLISFALAHVTSYLARVRVRPPDDAYRTPMFPLIPIAGGVACAALAVFQAVRVPDAGGIIAIWLALGVMLYVALFRRRAETADATAEAFDPRLPVLRGRTPLVLLPVANPTHAESMVDVANAMAPTEFARVLLLTIVPIPKDAEDPLAKLADAQDVVRHALSSSYAIGHAPEALITAAADPWREIKRVAQEHRCESLLLGLGQVPAGGELASKLDELMSSVDCDVAIMRARADWRLSQANRILVAIGGRGEQHGMRARLLGSICRQAARDITFVTVLPASASDGEVTATMRDITNLADVGVPGGNARVEVVRNDDASAALLDRAESHDLLILGLAEASWGRRRLGDFVLRVANEAQCPTIIVSRRPSGYRQISRPLRETLAVIPWREAARENR